METMLVANNKPVQTVWRTGQTGSIQPPIPAGLLDYWHSSPVGKPRCPPSHVAGLRHRACAENSST